MIVRKELVICISPDRKDVLFLINSREKDEDKMNQIFKKDEFIIIPFFKGRKQEFMVVNTKKEFKNGHTHLKSFKMAKYLINLARYKKINAGLRPYLLTSLKRISKDQEYIEKLEEILEVKKNKGNKDSYYNRAI